MIRNHLRNEVQTPLQSPLHLWTVKLFLPFICLAKTINLVLQRFKDNLFSSNHFLSFTISFSMLLARVFKSSPEPKKLVLSANHTNCNNFDPSQMSLMYRLKSLGPKTEPCGTPHSMFIYSHLFPENCTY